MFIKNSGYNNCFQCCYELHTMHCRMCEDACKHGNVGYFTVSKGEEAASLETEAKALDVQVGGGHYKKFKIQPVEFNQLNGLNCCESNIVKYACRHQDKGGAEDVKKIIHYANLLLELEYSS